MRTLVSAALAAALITVASPATAGEPKSEAGAKKVCRLLEPSTGTRMRERVCLTAEQWKKVEKLVAE